jgi:hypothetical protein
MSGFAPHAIPDLQVTYTTTRHKTGLQQRRHHPDRPLRPFPQFIAFPFGDRSEFQLANTAFERRDPLSQDVPLIVG